MEQRGKKKKSLWGTKKYFCTFYTLQPKITHSWPSLGQCTVASWRQGVAISWRTTDCWMAINSHSQLSYFLTDHYRAHLKLWGFDSQVQPNCDWARAWQQHVQNSFSCSVHKSISLFCLCTRWTNCPAFCSNIWELMKGNCGKLQ